MSMRKNMFRHDTLGDDRVDIVLDCSWEVSNDSSETCGFPTHYGAHECDDSTATLVLSTVVHFQYEIYYSNIEQPPTDFLEGYLLQQLAQRWGLSPAAGCQQRNGNIETRRLRGLASSSIANPTSFVRGIALGTRADHGADADASTRGIVPWTENCQAPVETILAKSSECRPASASFIVYTGTTADDDHTENQLSTISWVGREIRTLMHQGGLVVAPTPYDTSTASIDHVIFRGIPEMQSPTNNADNANAAQRTQTSSDSLAFSTVIILSASSAVVVMFMVAWGVYSRTRKATNRNNEASKGAWPTSPLTFATSPASPDNSATPKTNLKRPPSRTVKWDLPKYQPLEEKSGSDTRGGSEGGDDPLSRLHTDVRNSKQKTPNPISMVVHVPSEGISWKGDEESVTESTNTKAQGNAWIRNITTTPIEEPQKQGQNLPPQSPPNGSWSESPSSSNAQESSTTPTRRLLSKLSDSCGTIYFEPFCPSEDDDDDHAADLISAASSEIPIKDVLTDDSQYKLRVATQDLEDANNSSDGAKENISEWCLGDQSQTQSDNFREFCQRVGRSLRIDFTGQATLTNNVGVSYTNH